MDRKEFRHFLKQSQLFAPVPDECLDRITEKLTLENHGPGSEVFRVDDPADKVYIIKSGVVAICRTDPNTGKEETAAYLGERETLGEMSILTGSPRSSVARVPEKAQLFAISRKDFMSLLEEIPILGIQLATVLANRLEAWIMEQRLQIQGQELSGSLEYFDPSTLIQTLAQSDRTGLLTIVGGNEQTLAEIYIEEGEVCDARLGHLKGAEAFYQVFQSSNGKAFTFKVGDLDRIGQEDRIPHGTMALLFEANRLHDELNRLKKGLPDVNRIFPPKVQEFSWNDEATAPLAEEIWDLIVQGNPLSFILDEVPVSHYAVYSIVSQMLDKGQIGL